MRTTKRTAKIAIAALAAVAALGAGAGIAAASGGGDDDDRPITGAELVKASASALAYTGGGRVTDTEISDEDSFYEVEVTLADGTQVDVQLDRAFTVVGSKADVETDDGE